MSEKPLHRFEQPISVPGRRLLHHIPLGFVRKKVSGGGQRSVNQEIPLIPFIDFLLCIVLFLLASFSATGELPVDKNVQLPKAENVMDMVEAPMVAITGTQILVDGVPAGNTRAIEEANRLQRVDELFNVLKNKRELWKSLNPGRDFPGVAVLQVDRRVPALVVKSVFQTSAFAGYPNISFMVGRLGDEGGGGK
ncbi:MAG: biopolymer transporter ExbD [Myxococcales bacterium]|nr:biopolymer transporter ExbD [Myxococcales bacterium]MCB9577697.1 biopolymer transporter ExbD [Polyangiaceae bacterium]